MAKPDSESRLKHVVDMLMATKQFSNDKELEEAAQSFYDKLIIADKYKPKEKVSSRVTLVKALSGRKQGLSNTLDADYGLSQVSTVRKCHFTWLIFLNLVNLNFLIL